MYNSETEKHTTGFHEMLSLFRENSGL